jgi:hypothetical protein
MTDLFLCTRLCRDGYDYDVVVYFSCISYRPGCAAQVYGDPSVCYPAEPAEAEFEFVRAEFDGGEPDDAPGPITEAETATLRVWFEAHEAEALRAYVEQPAAASQDRADYEYELRRDERMEWVR